MSIGALFLGKEVFGYVGIPILGLAGSTYAQAGPSPSFFQVRPSSGCDLFALVAVVDATFLLYRDSVKPLVRHPVSDNFESTFLFTGMLACIFLIQSGKLQYFLNHRSRTKPYPLGAASINLAVAFALIAFHIYSLVGR